MSEEMSQAEILDRFVDDLVANSGASRPPGLDDGLADAAEMVVLAEQRSLGDANIPTDAVRARVWRGAVTEARSASPGRRGEILRRRPRPTLGLAGLAAIMLLALGLGIFVWGERPQPVSAATIVARAARAADDASAYGLQSYHGIVVGRSRGAASLPFTQSREEIWFQAPDKKRIEIASAPIPPPTAIAAPGQPTVAAVAPAPRPAPVAGRANPRGASLIYVSDGANAWQYDADQGRVEQIAPYPITGSAFGATSLATLLKNARENAAVRLVGSDTVAGRSAYVLVLIPKDQTSSSPLGAHTRIWVDRQTYQELRSQVWDARGNLLGEWSFVSLEVNASIDPSLFRFSPPPGVPVFDARPRPTPRADELPGLWRQVAGQVSYRVFMPTDVPSGLTPGLAPHVDAKAPWVIQTYRSPTDPSALTIIERLPESRALGTGQWQSVTVGDLTGLYREDGAVRQLVVERDGTEIALQGETEVTREDLVRVAASLQPVSPASAVGS